MQNVLSAGIIRLPGGSDSSGLQMSPKPVSSNVRNAGLPGENTTEIQLFFYKTLETIIPEKRVYKLEASTLQYAEPEAFWFSDQNLYSYVEFEFSDFSDFKEIFILIPKRYLSSSDNSSL